MDPDGVGVALVHMASLPANWMSPSARPSSALSGPFVLRG